MIFTPAKPLEFYTEYTIKVSTALEDTNGLKMAAEKISTFTTDGPFAVVETLPKKDQTEVYLYVAPSVIFSHKVDSGSITASSFKLMKDGNAVAGKIEVIDFPTEDGRSIARFIPTAPLAPSSDYTFEITKDVKSAAGTSVLEALSINFKSSANILIYDGFESSFFRQMLSEAEDDAYQGLTKWVIVNNSARFDLWEIGAPNYVSTDKGNLTVANTSVDSGSKNVLATLLNRDYPNSAHDGFQFVTQISDERIVFATPFVVGANGATVEFYAWVQTEFDTKWKDGLVVRMWEWNEKESLYYYISDSDQPAISDGDFVTDFEDDTLKTKRGISGSSEDNVYTKFTVELDKADWSGKKIGLGFTFFSNLEITAAGVYIDDVKITNK